MQIKVGVHGKVKYLGGIRIFFWFCEPQVNYLERRVKDNFKETFIQESENSDLLLKKKRFGIISTSIIKNHIINPNANYNTNACLHLYNVMFGLQYRPPL